MGTIPLTRNPDLLEAMAQLKSLQTFASDLSRNDRVICYTDNQDLCNSMRSGHTKHSAVHDVILEIHQTALELGIHLDPQQVPREHNTIADRLSKGHCPIVEESWSPLFKMEQARRVHRRRRNRSAISGSFAATYTGEKGVVVWKVALRLLKRFFKRTLRLPNSSTDLGLLCMLEPRLQVAAVCLSKGKVMATGMGDL